MKSLSYFVVGLLLLGGFAALGIENEADKQLETINISFLELDIIEGETFVELEIEGANNYIFNGGKPMLPIHTKTLSLPFGVKIKDIKCEVQDVETVTLSSKILPAPQLLIKDITVSSNKPMVDETVYNSEELFPCDWFSYHVGVGLNGNMEHTTFLTINAYPVRYSPTTDIIYYAENLDFTITYDEPDTDPFPANTEHNLVIIAPSKFSSDLQKLVDHKISVGIQTVLKTTEKISNEYSGVDEPEKIKYFIKDAIETLDTDYVLLVGGLKSLIWAKPRDDVNQGTKDWYVPVRYSNLIAGEPGYLCDLYYADIYKEGGVFDNWDSNGNGVFAEWSGFKKDDLDLYPDVALGRLACRNSREVKSVVDKIISYENNADDSWFKKMIVVSGDGFLDQEDLDIQWDVNGLLDGDYTIYAQSENPEGTKGPIDIIHVKLDRTVETSLSFNHDDHLKTDTYPFAPIAEIVSVSDGDILGNTDYNYVPKGSEAYLNSYTHWADVDYVDGILHIRGKSYDPQPYGNVTDIRVWVENSAGETVFSDERLGTETYFEGEWTTGERLLLGRGGGLYYMPDDFEKEILWTSNGNWRDQPDVINALDEGCGFIFFSGHGSPGWWGNHLPGVPGNRHHGEAEGLLVFDFNGPPYLPMEKLSNDYKTPVCVVGGCHNSDFNVSLIPTIIDSRNALMTHCYGRPTAECWSWWITRLANRGAIACIGNTGYGYGNLGKWCNIGGVDNWITTEFFRQYGEEGHDILGEAFRQAIASYISHFKTTDDPDLQWDEGHEKTVQQWVLLGDPSLKMGGYP